MAERTASGKKKVVLVADDDPAILYSVRRVLAGSYSVIEASNGEDAVALTRRNKPDMVLMDVTMPKKDGFTACVEIKCNKATSSIPVIMLTGIGYDLNKALASSMGADGYVTKPFKPQELQDAVERFLNGTG